MIAAALALLVLPVAAHARDRGPHGRHGAHSHPPRSAGVVRSFRHGVLTIRLAGGGTKSGEVTGSTKLTCQARRSQSRRKRARGALAAPEAGPGEDPGAEDDTGDDTGDDTSDDGEGTGDDTPDDPGDGGDEPKPAPPRDRGKGRGCSTATLRRGTQVKAARLGSSPAGAVWTRIALLRRQP
jgi:hypothetical protein